MSVKPIWKLFGIKKLPIVMNKLIKSNLIVLKELSIILVVFGIWRNRFSFVILLINLWRNLCLYLKLGLRLGIVSRYRKNMIKLLISSIVLSNWILTILTLTLCVDMNMYIMKISLKLKKCSNKLSILMSDIIVLGGDKEILLINNKSMIGLVSSLSEPLKLIIKILYFIHLWGWHLRRKEISTKHLNNSRNLKNMIIKMA